MDNVKKVDKVDKEEKVKKEDKGRIIGRLLNEYGDRLLRLSYIYLRDFATAEDAVQETIIKAHKSLDKMPSESPESEKAWLLRIAINTCKDFRRFAWFRARSRNVSLDDIRNLAAANNYESTLTIAVSALPDRLKTVILLHYYEGMNADEISATLSISRSTVYERLNAAKNALRSELDGRY